MELTTRSPRRPGTGAGVAAKEFGMLLSGLSVPPSATAAAAEHDVRVLLLLPVLGVLTGEGAATGQEPLVGGRGPGGGALAAAA